MTVMTNRIWVVSVTCLLAIGCGVRSPSQNQEAQREVHIAAAANLRNVLDDIARAFEAKTSIHVVPTIGATAQLAQQIGGAAL